MAQAVAVKSRPLGAAAQKAGGPSLHPRRPPANCSVSLKHSSVVPSQIPQSSPEQAQSASDRSNLSLTNNKHSSGESSNAEHWFDKSNNNVRGNTAAFVDNDPPFYHRNSSGESPPDRPGLHSRDSGESLPYRPGNQHQVLSVSGSTEEYRSVIDDLTIQNKKLKQKLKKYTKTSNPQLDSDKLFEVRVHGLPLQKKRELDELLKQFALGLNASPVSGSSAVNSNPLLAPFKHGVPQLPNKISDSGYGSAGASALTPAARSNSSSASQKQPRDPGSNSGSNTQASAQSASARDSNIRSYLHDIPEGLLPKHPTAMTEKTKKKMVVRRLEQIFGGRGAASEGHQLPIQQQEVSHSAAKADRSAIEAQGREVSMEGVREAPIMETETEDPMDVTNPGSGEITPPQIMTKSPPDTKPASEKDLMSPTLEQRPTRPLDLDPHRAQVPSENVEYLRHLGFPIPDVTDPATDGGESWIYLNLLINMAQLHTINVTGDFVKKALSDYSTKLELSSDGRKVRWKGSQRNSRADSSAADQSQEGSPESQAAGRRPKRKRVNLSSNDSSRSPSNDSDYGRQSRLLKSPRPANSIDNKLNYTPLFFHKTSSDDADDASLDESDSIMSSSPDETMGNSAFKSASSSKRREDGPITYYNNARFCTDLSGDSRKSPRLFPHLPAEYAPYTATAIGSTVRSHPTQRMFSRTRDSPLYQQRPSADATRLDPDDGAVSLSGLSLSSSSSSPKHVQFADPDPNADLEASGIGGVRPADNLAITVLRRHARTAAANLTPSAIISTQSRSLPPSTLPPPSYAPASAASSSAGSDDGSDISMDAYDGSNPTLPPLLAADCATASFDLDDSDIAVDSDDDDDDGSVDMLATARVLDPEAIRAQEREYDAEMAERLAEEIPAGSSAATLGGGSGFASPVDGVVEQKGENESDNESVASVGSL